MKCTIPEISWHNREPVLSVDIHPISNDVYKLASSGGDSHILIWNMCLCKNGSVKQEVVSDLTRHQKSVNTVRWSWSGKYLASADDDANIIVWQLKTDNILLLEGDSDDKEIWVVYKILRGHKEDIYDLCWSVDNMKLLSGSIDNTSIIWDLTKGKMDHIMTDHKGFVQGVAWDPKNQIIATISTDRTCRIFDVYGKQVKARIHKGKLPLPSNHNLYDKESKFFHDDTFKSFFRRLQFSPDGSLLIIPSGYFQVDDSNTAINCTLIFTLDNWTEPAAVLPLDGQSSTAVRFCPLLFQLREDGPEPLIKLPYRMLFAIGTDHDIILYDTQQSKPFARFHEIHYTRITDLTWSPDGLLLIASSTDGFCTLITFEPNELGNIYDKVESDEEILEKDENVDINNENEEKEEVKKRPSFIQQWVQSTPKKPKIDNELVVIDVDDNESEQLRKEINILIPRRITPKPVGESNKFGDAKPIEVRRKPRIIEKTESVPRRIVPTKIEDIKEETVKDTTNIENRSAKLVILLENSKELEIKRKQSEDTDKESKIDPSSQNFDNKQLVAIKKTLPKIKLGGSVSKKQNTTPKKTNPLLEFLKRSSDKKNSKSANVEIKKVDLTLDEEEARDGFDKEAVTDKNARLNDTTCVEEDCTEDFSLQLEDTRDTVKEKRKEHDGKDVDKAAEENKEVNRIIEISDDSCSPKKKNMEDNIIQKKPRRVPFITLTSPKGKKKPVTENNKIT